EDDVARDRLLLAVELDLHEQRSIGLALVTEGLGRGVNGAAELQNTAFHDLGALGIHAREDVREGLDDGQLAAEFLVDHAELEADDPAADHEEALGNFAERYGLFGADDLLAVELEGGNFNRGGAGGDDDAFGGLDRLLGAVGVGDLDRLGAGDHRGADHQLGARALDQAAHAAGELLDDALFPVLHRVRIELD